MQAQKGWSNNLMYVITGEGGGRQGGKTARIRSWTSVLSNSEHMFSAGLSEKWQMKTYKKANNVSRTIQYV